MAYVGKWNKHRQCIVVRAETAHLPHVEVIWYLAGMHEGAVVPVLDGQTPEQAAQAVLERHAHKTGSWRPIELFDDCPPDQVTP